MPVAKERLEILQVCKLLQCCRTVDMDQIAKLCDSGVPLLINFNEPENGDTALGIAASKNNEDLLDHILSLGAHPDVVDFKGRAAIMRAAELGNVECFERLAIAGANMKLKDVKGKGIIWYCMANTQRHARILELALQYGADVNNKAKDGKPVFVEACEQANENEQFCMTLLRRGAEANSVYEVTGLTALMAACKAGNANITSAILAAGGDPDSLDKWKSHAAHFAAKRCNPKPKNNDGNVAKQIAKDGGFKEALKECKKGEKTFGRTGKNNEPWAIRLYDWSFARAEPLTEQFKKFDPDSTGQIPKDDFLEVLQSLSAPLPEDDTKKLLMAHEKVGRDNLIDFNEFLGGKKYVNKLYLMASFEGKKKKKKGGKGGKKKKGKTKIPLPIATKEDGPRTEGGNPPEEFVARHIHFTDNTRFDRDIPPTHPLQDDSAWYLKHPDRTFVNMNEAAKFGDFDTLRVSLEKGVPVDVRDKYYKTPLITACSQGNFNMAAFLIEKGADVNAKDNFKWSPLHHACHSGQLDIVQLLLSNGAELDAPALNGGTPLIRAIESSSLDIVTYLIEKGAKLQIENKKGQTPMDIAGAYADPRVYSAVKAKWDSLPAPKDKKGGKGKGSPKAKRPTTGTSGAQPPTAASAALTNEEQAVKVRKGSILRAASALAGGIEEREDITYVPLKAWTKQPNTKELMCARQINRERFGWEIDFPETFQMPFLANVSKKVEIMEKEDD
ncbi:ANKEF1 [Bugula neritina]|uniref:ANKEF1 n=1 Tax=Bugula neritina TaxID=10212 RepID=A0A7J7JQM5_BUGNE|nr:ANKEF1 [Bugula neritina]